MNRRAYLAMAATVGFTGCVNSEPLDSSQGQDVSRERDGEREPKAPRTKSEVDGRDESADESNEEHGDEDESSEPAHPGPVGTFDDFEDLSHWTVHAGSLSADDSASLIGSQSALLEADRSTDRVWISREVDDPLDLSDVAPGLAVTSEAMVVPLIRLRDTDGNRIDYRRAIVGDVPFERYNFGVETADDAFDPTAIAEIDVVLWTGERTAQFRCDDLHFTPRPQTGKVMIQFDDGFETDYTEGLPILEEYGYPAATFVNPGRIGNENRLSRAQAERLRDAGWVVGSHTHTHPNLATLDPAEQEREIRTAKEWLEAHGFEEGARYFAYPFGGYDAATLELVAKHHDLAFAGGRPVQGYAVNPTLCSRIGDPTADRAKTALELTAETRGITTLFYHELEGALRTDFEETMAHLHELESAGELEVILPKELEAEYLFTDW